MQKLMGDEGLGGGALFFSTDPKCLWSEFVRGRDVLESYKSTTPWIKSLFASGIWHVCLKSSHVILHR